MVAVTKDDILFYIENTRTISQFAEEMNLELVDLLEAFEEKIDWDFYKSEMGICPTDLNQEE